MGYIVTGPLAIVKDDAGKDRYVYQGAPVPEFVSEERAQELVADGLVSSDDDPKSEKAVAKKAVASKKAAADDAAAK